MRISTSASWGFSKDSVNLPHFRGAILATVGHPGSIATTQMWQNLKQVTCRKVERWLEDNDCEAMKRHQLVNKSSSFAIYYMPFLVSIHSVCGTLIM